MLMASEFGDIENLVRYPKKGILSEELAKSTSRNITLFCMAKGTELSEHTASREGFVFVLDGKGTFVLGKKKIKMEPGVFILMKKKAPHSLSAKSNLAFLLVLTGN